VAISSTLPSTRLNALKPEEHCLSMGKDTENSSDDYKGNTEGDIRQLVIPDAQGGQRLDQALSALLPEFSRNRIQNWIRARKIAVDDNWGTTRMKVSGGEAVRVEIEPDPGATPDAPEAIPLDVVFEDPVLLVINKPVGLVVHPGSGNPRGTLLNALLHRVPQVAELPRAGIVHRLDKDTSGLLVVAKHDQAIRDLQGQFKRRSVRKRYLALLIGDLTPDEGIIEAPIGRNPVHRQRMAVAPRGKPARTRWRVLLRYRDAQGHSYSLVEVGLHTGRTHQIRVHFAWLGYPLVGDRVYGPAHPRFSAPRQFLHARELAFTHPVTDAELVFRAPLPQDLRDVLADLIPYPTD
jgi:23S rRNA pseudouridine1911/1915/1917 synthase